MWDLKEGLEAVRQLQTKINEAGTGYYVALTGGVLRKGHSDKDLDIIVYPELFSNGNPIRGRTQPPELQPKPFTEEGRTQLRQQTDFDTQPLAAVWDAMGWRKTTDADFKDWHSDHENYGIDEQGGAPPHILFFATKDNRRVDVFFMNRPSYLTP